MPSAPDLALKIFAATYLLWGMMWAMVAFHYGRASHFSWKEQGGKWKECLRDFIRPYTYAWKRLLCKLKVVTNPEFCAEEIPSRYSIGHYLRFSIFLGALCPIFLTTTLTQTDRTSWSLWTFTFVIGMLISSIMGAAGHLFIAYRMIPGNWTRLIIASTLWMILAPILFIYINWP